MLKRLGIMAGALALLGVGIATAQGTFPWNKIRNILKSEFELQGSSVVRTHFDFSEATTPVPISVVGTLVCRKKTTGALECSADGAPFTDVGGGAGGHTIKDALGEVMPPRSTLVFPEFDCTDDGAGDKTDCPFTTPRPMLRTGDTIAPVEPTVTCVALSGTADTGCLCFTSSPDTWTWDSDCDPATTAGLSLVGGQLVFDGLAKMSQVNEAASMTLQTGTGLGPFVVMHGEDLADTGLAGDAVIAYGGKTLSSNGNLNGSFTVCKWNAQGGVCDPVISCDSTRACTFHAAGATTLSGALVMGGNAITGVSSMTVTCDPAVNFDCGYEFLDNTGFPLDSIITTASTFCYTNGGNLYCQPKGVAKKKMLDETDKQGGGAKVATVVGVIPDGNLAIGGGGDGRLVDGGVPGASSSLLGQWTFSNLADSQTAALGTGGPYLSFTGGKIQGVRCRQLTDARLLGSGNCGSGDCYQIIPTFNEVLQPSSVYCNITPTVKDCRSFPALSPIFGDRFDLVATTGVLTDNTYDVECDVFGTIDVVTTTTTTSTTSTTTTTLSGATNYTNDANVMGCYFFDDSLDLGKDSCGGTGSGDDPFSLVGTTVPTYDSTNKQQGTGSVAMGTGGGYLNCTGSSVCPNINAKADTAITIVAWSKVPATSNWRTVVSQGKDGTKAFRAFAVQNGATPSLYIINPSNVAVEEQATASTTTLWTHYCSTYDGANVTVVLDGVQDCSTPGCDTQTGTIGQTTAGTDVHIGAVIGSSGAPKDFHKGNIDELAIFNRALTVAECCEICRMGLDGQTTDRGATCGTCTLP